MFETPFLGVLGNRNPSLVFSYNFWGIAIAFRSPRLPRRRGLSGVPGGEEKLGGESEPRFRTPLLFSRRVSIMFA